MSKRDKRLILGGIVGAALGIAAAHIISRRMEEIEAEGKDVRLRGGLTDWIKLGMAVLGLMHQFSRLLEPDSTRK